jgi:hypothetical protein
VHVLGLVDRAQDGVDGAGADLLAALDELDELLDDRLRLRDLEVLPREREPVSAQVDRAAEPVAKGVQHSVADARELSRYLVRDVQNGLHNGQCRALCGASLGAREVAGGFVT